MTIVVIYVILKNIYKRKTKNRIELNKKNSIFSPKRYFRYIKLFLNSKILITIAVFSIISNLFINFQENKYKKIYSDGENIEEKIIIISDKMEKIYSQSQKALFREIIWPSLVAIERKIDAKLTCMMTPQFDYGDENEPREGEVAYYLKLLKEEYGEAGLSSGNVSGTGLSEKMEKDETFWKKEAPDYCFQSLYLQNEDELGDALECEELVGIRRIVTRESQPCDDPIVSFAGAEGTRQRATGDGVNHTFMDDFRQRCIQTALGYSNTVWDLLAAAYPEKKDDAWEILSKEAASNICTYQKPFTAFDETTISKSDQRIRRFLALSYSAESEDNMISLHVDGLEEEAWFLLHTGTREAEDIQGGSFSVVEDGVYLICAEEDEVKIRLSEEEEKQLFYYED